MPAELQKAFDQPLQAAAFVLQGLVVLLPDVVIDGAALREQLTHLTHRRQRRAELRAIRRTRSPTAAARPKLAHDGAANE